ncbi:MAG: glutamate racemase, partial [Elusimicrobiota bacterium]|nr:glutamate racemase [Elusimicrobiota bacterium]
MKQPIGIFDSGIGGLTVMKEIINLMPNEDIFYFGDTARVPYGNKSPKTIQKFSMQIANFLLKKNIKILIIACNTATSFSLKILTNNLDIPVIGVIEPGA